MTEDSSASARQSAEEEVAAVAAGALPQAAGGEADKCSVLCVFGCLALLGCRGRIVRRLAFSPPPIPGYLLKQPEPGEQSKDGNRDGKADQSSRQQQLFCLFDGHMTFDVRELQDGHVKIRFSWVHRRCHKLASLLLFCQPVQKAPLVIFSHGNSTDIGFMFPHLYALCAKAQVNVLGYDYSGYGRSGGSPSEGNTYRDIRAIWAFAVHTLKASPRLILLYGQSVGSGPTCELATKEEIGGIVLHSPIASGLRIFLQDLNKAPWFDAYKNVEKIRRVSAPLYILHAEQDSQVPCSHSVQLYHAFLKQRRNNTEGESTVGSHDWKRELHTDGVMRWWVPDADHNDIEEKHPVEYYDRIRCFIEYVQSRSSNGTHPTSRDGFPKRPSKGSRTST